MARKRYGEDDILRLTREVEAHVLNTVSPGHRWRRSTALIAATFWADFPFSSKVSARNASHIDLASSDPITRAAIVIICALFDNAARWAE